MAGRFTFVSVLALAGAIACVVGGSATATVLAAPTITNVSPTSSHAGGSIVITGTDLAGATVTFTQRANGAVPVTAPREATTVSPDGTRITVYLPANGDVEGGQIVQPGNNTIRVTTPEGTATWTQFVVQAQATPGRAPYITRFRPKHAAPGAMVTIFGTHLSGTNLVTLGGMKVRVFRIPSDTRILAKVPNNAHSGKWLVKTPLGMAQSLHPFQVAPL